MHRFLGLVGLSLIFGQAASAQVWPETRAELTDYRETSHYVDVISFLKQLQHNGAPISVQYIGTSPRGRAIPLVIASEPPVTSPAEARRLGRPIVYVEANIHAGEVEGKEAVLMILRRLCQQGDAGLLSKIVLIVTPIYNIDGNEAFGPVDKTRPEQDGPIEAGERANGAGLDLNRDAIKAESPEMRAVLANVYNAWDPDVMMDLHTTDGTRHGWELTYSPPLNPNTNPQIMRIARDEILPDVRRQIATEDHLLLFDYGNVEGRQGKQAWYSYEPFGRYCTNYEGLRNRISILSEATTFIPFKARVEITDKFVSHILAWVGGHASEVLNATRQADAQVVTWGLDPGHAPELGVTFQPKSRGDEAVLLEHKGSKAMPEAVGGSYPGRPSALDKVKMPIFDRFEAVKTAKFPSGYLIPASETKTIELLRRHGISVEKLDEPWSAEGATFAITKVNQGNMAFQNHRLIQLEGAFSMKTVSAGPGDYLVRTAQPLGVLAFSILEPEGQDGAAAWGFLGDTFAVGNSFPIQKVFSPITAVTEKL